MPITFKQLNAPYQHWEFVQTDSGDRMRIVPERGGLVTEWLCNGREMLYFDQSRFSDISKSVRGGIPVLFPICGDIKADQLLFPNALASLNQHGFARDIPWQIQLLKDQQGVSLSCTDNEFTRKVFPFSFCLEMELRLLSSSLDITIFISNLSKDSMPYSFGLHPYFKVSDLSSVTLEGLSETCFNHLEMAEMETSNQLIRLSEGVDFLTFPKGAVTLIDQVADSGIHLETLSPLDLIVIWTDPPRSMVCLEPWTSPRQSLLSGERKLSLQPGEKFKLKCRYLSC